MSSPAGVLYLDSSAIVKLVVREAETDALATELAPWRLLATSSITSIEVSRAADRARENGRADVLPAEAVAALLGSMIEMVLTDEIRRVAATLRPPELRSLDAIHVASALALGADLAAVVTYDVRMQQAAVGESLPILAPRS